MVVTYEMKFHEATPGLTWSKPWSRNEVNNVVFCCTAMKSIWGENAGLGKFASANLPPQVYIYFVENCGPRHDPDIESWQISYCPFCGKPVKCIDAQADKEGGDGDGFPDESAK